MPHEAATGGKAKRLPAAEAGVFGPHLGGVVVGNGVAVISGLAGLREEPTGGQGPVGFAAESSGGRRYGPTSAAGGSVQLLRRRGTEEEWHTRNGSDEGWLAEDHGNAQQAMSESSKACFRAHYRTGKPSQEQITPQCRAPRQPDRRATVKVRPRQEQRIFEERQGLQSERGG